MSRQESSAAGPYFEYDSLPALHGTEPELPRLHPYEEITPGRYITPGGGRLTTEKTTRHYRIRLDHLGCPAQDTEEKNSAYRNLALAAEGHCLKARCQHAPSYQDGVYRMFDVRLDSGITLPAFIRAVLAIELGDFRPAEIIAADTAKLMGPPPRE
ncbi:DUF6420 family protein [Streptomyces hydrogenans]|uniref:DUF6420 family protein n=1 Tax=Streptomyces hydrogenans TaxID=1873719 RepID=UPI0036BF1316